MKYKLGLIGLGRITEEYLYGLNNNQNFIITSVCDINKDAKGRKLYNQTFYENYKKMIRKEKLDYVLICTDPYTHYEIAKHCLKHKQNIILEKPAVLNMKDFDHLVVLANKYHCDIKYMFHWRSGEEAIQFKNKYDMDKITSIDMFINDPYCNANGNIKNERVSLRGCWIDSGVNALSFIDYLIKIKSYKIISYSREMDPFTCLPTHTRTRLLINDKVNVKIEIDWTKNINYKMSNIYFGKKVIKIDHSQQSIIDKKIYIFDKIPRLSRHYYNFFNNFGNDHSIDVNQSRIIHEILFKVGDKQ